MTPWPFLADAIAGRTGFRISRAELESCGVRADALLDAGLLERARIDDAWSPPHCTESCMPGFDFDKRLDEGLVGVWCPTEHACTRGVEWHRLRDMERFSCSAHRAADAFRALHRLRTIDGRDVSRGITKLGVMHKRGLVVPVVIFDGFVRPLEETCRGLRAHLRGDGLIVLMGKPPTRTSFRSDERIVLWELRADDDGDLGLMRALDEIDPTWPTRRLADNKAIFDDVRIDLCTVPGERHVVTIDGHALAGFRQSDLKFLRLARLAIERRENHEADGWLEKHTLEGNEHDHDLEALRSELRKGDHPTLGPDERAALIKSADGRVRLAVEAHHVSVDLAGFRLLQEEIEVRRGSSPNVRLRATNMNLGVATARRIWGVIERDARRRVEARSG